MTYEQMIEMTENFKRLIEDAQEKIARFEGELSQLEIQKQDAIEECEENFGCSLKTLKEKLPQMEAELEEKLRKIQEEIGEFE
jgi:predicted component of viral defense system (DUF524 family)